MTLVITSACIDVKDGVCTTSCPVDCIYEGGRMYYIHPTECIECGMCESICPVDAIRYDDEILGEDRKFIKLNGDPFRNPDGSLHEPQGWYQGTPPIQDPKEIQDWPENLERES